MAKSNHGRKKPTKAHMRDVSERKRDERAIRIAHRKQMRDQSYLAEDENFASFSTQLQMLGLKLKDIPGDGNCLFRALGDQLDGHSRNHMRHRGDTVEYIREHRDAFEPFMEDNISFEKHLSHLSNSGTYAGNDSIVAFARKNEADVVIHQLNSPVWKVTGSPQSSHPCRELHIAYHNGDHYSSVRRITDSDNSPTNFRTVHVPQPVEKPTSKKDRSRSREASRSSECNGDDIALYVMQQTGNSVLQQVKGVLEDLEYDVEAAVAFLLQLEELNVNPDIKEDQGISKGGESSELWKEDGTGSRIFGDLKDDPPGKEVKGAQPKAKPNNREQKRQTKLEKKSRKTERDRKRRQQKKGGEERDGDDEATLVVTGEMEQLAI